MLAGASVQHESAGQERVFTRLLSFNQIKYFMFFLEGSQERPTMWWNPH